MPQVKNVLVVGGGIGGMTLATALRRGGVAAEIVELNPGWSAIGYGISIQGATLRALKEIGVLDRCVQSGFGYSKLVACDADGKVTGTVELPRLLGKGYPECVGMMRPKLHEILHDALVEAGVPTRRGVTLTSLDQRGEMVDVKFTDGTHGTYDLVVGADGINSQVREMLFGPGITPVDTGQRVWRAMVPRAPHIRARHMFYGPNSKAGLNPVNEDDMYIFLVEPSDDLDFVSDQELPSRMRTLLMGFGGVIAEAREKILHPSRVLCRRLGSLLLPAPWYRGRVVLIGDAAHSPTPQLASGAGMAVEDSIVLSQLLQKDAPIEALLEQFMVRRFERCRMVVDASRQLTEWEKTPKQPGADPIGLLARTNAALAAPI
jgi:2-polyprenyl-6-methoxyphenol hydroxylase-like FAD-dependent oxidoreductase